MSATRSDAGREDDDVALTILHTADWHLGMRFPSFAEHEPELTRRRLMTIDAIFGLAERNRVNAVLCAGDLFDEPTPPEPWWRGLLERLAKLGWTDRHVFLLPGNHDPLVTGSPWSPGHPFRRALPDFVHVVDRDDFTFAFGDDAVLHAAPCRSMSGRSDLTEQLPVRERGDSRIRIGMVHGQTFEFPGFQTNFPISKHAAAERGFDYLAIGDTHAFRVYPPEDQPTVYPGAPEPTQFGEIDAGSVALAFFSRRTRRPQIRREKVGYWTWVERTCTSLAQLRALDGEDHARTVMRLRVQMQLGPTEYRDAEAILRRLVGSEAEPGKVGILELDRSLLVLDTRDLEAALDELPDSLRAAALELRALAEHGDKAEVAKKALWQLVQLASAELRPAPGAES
jgi:DNA repair exonuclease SbcCD nuclease subunit